MINAFYFICRFLEEQTNWLFSLIEKQQSAIVVLSSTALVGAFAAYFGTVAAQKSINREVALRLRIEKIASANAAHSLATVIFNQALSLKKQYFLPTFEKWHSQKTAAINAINTGQQPAEPLEIHMNSFPAFHFPLKELSDQIYGKLTLNGRPLAVISELFQASHTLVFLSEKHDRLEREFRGLPRDQVIASYLSLPNQNGMDSRYQHICEGALLVIDDLIFFSNLLANDLIAYGQRQKKFAPRRQRNLLPEVNKPGTLSPEFEYLVPNRENHGRWLESHVLNEPQKPKLFKWFFS